MPISSSRSRAVMAMLCLSLGEPLERDHVSRLLWPGRFQAQARASLRQCLLGLDRALAGVLQDPGADVLVFTHGTLALDAARVRCDVDELLAALEGLHIDEASALLAAIGNKPVLDQMDFGEAFQAWVQAQRRRVEGRLQVAVSRALAELLREGRMGDHDRLHEAWAASGRADAGLRDERIRLAVLPFGQRDELGGPLFLAEAVVDELVARLAGVAGLAVVSRASVASVADGGRTISAMAAMLRVSHMVEGLVERFADGIRVTLRLVDGQTDSVIWSDRYDGTLESALRARPHIGGNMIAALCAALGVAPRSRPARLMTGSREAYALYLQGRALTYRAIGDGVLEKAIELLEQALAIDPDFAECWTALAEAHVNVAVFTPCLERVERSERAADCAARAVAIDAEQGHAHAMLGIHEWTRANPCAALDHAFEAHRLEPGNADVAMRLGSFLLYIGHTRAALAHIEKAVELDPVNGRNYALLCAALFNLGDYEEARAAGRRMIDLGFPGMWLAVVEAAMGEHEQAVETYYRQRLLMNTVMLPPAGTAAMNDDLRDAYWGVAARGVCSGRAEDRAMYCQLLDGLHATMLDGCDPSIAFPAIWMGHSELVMKLYGQQIHPANMFGLMSLWADVEPIRQTRLHPAFLDFARGIGLVAAWEKHGWPDLLPQPAAGNC